MIRIQTQNQGQFLTGTPKRQTHQFTHSHCKTPFTHCSLHASIKANNWSKQNIMAAVYSLYFWMFCARALCMEQSIQLKLKWGGGLWIVLYFVLFHLKAHTGCCILLWSKTQIFEQLTLEGGVEELSAWCKSDSVSSKTCLTLLHSVDCHTNCPTGLKFQTWIFMTYLSDQTCDWTTELSSSAIYLFRTL